jgi:hypothetical protein
LATSTTSIREYDAVTGLGDAAGRVRAIRLYTRNREEADRWWPENPAGGGAAASHIGLRHHASFVMGLATTAPSDAPRAVAALEGLPLRPGHFTDNGAPFTDPAGMGTFRAYLERLIDRLAMVQPADAEGWVRRARAALSPVMAEAVLPAPDAEGDDPIETVAGIMRWGRWALRIDFAFRDALFVWQRQGDPPPEPELSPAALLWRDMLRDELLTSRAARSGICSLWFCADAALPQGAATPPSGVTRTTTVGFDMIATAARLWRDTQSRSAASTERRN